jgi:hypothetical protein
MLSQKTDVGNVFHFMKSEESMAGEDSELEETCSELAGTHFTIKNKIPMKFPEFKRSGIGLIAEFHGFPNRFPNQDSWLKLKLETYLQINLKFKS